PGNVKPVTLHTPLLNCPVKVKEGEIKILYLYNDAVIETTGNLHLEFTQSGKITAHGEGNSAVIIHRPGENESRDICFSNTTSKEFSIKQR
ncbi:MAG: hypothetical protein IJC27_04215, partial [Lentisphaeria bacterium]|nr:hypothetical protein [Lentisphaeria bacterium]